MGFASHTAAVSISMPLNALHCVLFCPSHLMGLSSSHLLSLFPGYQTPEQWNYQTGRNWFSALFFCTRGPSSPPAKIKISKTFWTKHLRNQYFHFPPGHPFFCYHPSSAPMPGFLYFATCYLPFCTVFSPSACSQGLPWKVPLFFPSLLSYLLSFSSCPLHLLCQPSSLTWLIWTCAFKHLSVWFPQFCSIWKISFHFLLELHLLEW